MRNKSVMYMYVGFLEAFLGLRVTYYVVFVFSSLCLTGKSENKVSGAV